MQKNLREGDRFMKKSAADSLLLTLESVTHAWKESRGGCAWSCCRHAFVFQGSFVTGGGSVFRHERHSRPQLRGLLPRCADSFHRRPASLPERRGGGGGSSCCNFAEGELSHFFYMVSDSKPSQHCLAPLYISVSALPPPPPPHHPGTAFDR